MEDSSLTLKILKSLIAPARFGRGPTLFLICQGESGNGCTIYEHLPEGKCVPWPETAAQSVQHAEGLIYQYGTSRN